MRRFFIGIILSLSINAYANELCDNMGDLTEAFTELHDNGYDRADIQHYVDSEVMMMEPNLQKISASKFTWILDKLVFSNSTNSSLNRSITIKHCNIEKWAEEFEQQAIMAN